MKRVFLIVLDSVGAGALPDWADYDETPGHTLENVAKAVGGLSMPNCEKLGLGNILSLVGVPPAKIPLASYGKAPLTTKGKDTTAGHWEIMGIVLEKPFPVFPEGFPVDLIAALEESFGIGILCNKPYSGTKVIEDYGEEHIATGKPIVYTSADSVLQIACHDAVYSADELYDMCEKARALCVGEYAVGRVIARPFTGEPYAFTRTKYRRDFSLLPPKPNYLTALTDRHVFTCGIGKIGDIFNMQGIQQTYPVKGNELCLKEIVTLMQEDNEGFFFGNLVDFDMLYGHRNDPQGYAKALEHFDRSLSRILPLVHADDLLLITADHGNDPTTVSGDHNREYVPVLMYAPGLPGNDLGILHTMSDIGATAYYALTGEDAPEINGKNVL
jgi:phosphopentomutase